MRVIDCPIIKCLMFFCLSSNICGQRKRKCLRVIFNLVLFMWIVLSSSYQKVKWLSKEKLPRHLIIISQQLIILPTVHSPTRLGQLKYFRNCDTVKWLQFRVHNTIVFDFDEPYRKDTWIVRNSLLHLRFWFFFYFSCIPTSTSKTMLIPVLAEVVTMKRPQ